MKKINLFFVLMFILLSELPAQIVKVKGTVSTETEPVKNALITFTDEKDTTRKYSALTDSLGNYNIGLITSIKENAAIIPSKFELEQNYPNPFTNSTAISYKLNKQSDVHVTIYDILGREIKKYNIGEQLSGVHGILWDGRNNFGEKVTTGIYFCRLQADKESRVNKMIFTKGSGINTNLTLSSNLVSATYLRKETTTKTTSKSYTVRITNNNNTKPEIEPLKIKGITIANDTTINIFIQKKGLSIYVMEKDNLFGGYQGVDIYHEILIINTSADSVSFTVESPIPDTIQRKSLRSPSFGYNAIIPAPYHDFFDIPNINHSFYTNKPDLSTGNSYIWKNIKLGPSDLMEVPYSNYYGNDGRMFIEKLGTSRFLYLEVVLNCSIKRDSINSKYINVEIKETVKNITNNALSEVGIFLFVPRELETKFDPPNNSVYTKLYNLISDTVISSANYNCYLFNQDGEDDGFGFPAVGQEIETGWDNILPYQSYEFVFKMKIEPLLDKFEIYPSYGVGYMTTSSDRVWPASIITLNNNKYQGEVHYLKAFGLSMPAYILFSINKDTLRVVNPDDIMPTFTPNY